MKKVEHLDKYVIAPNLLFYGGFIYDGEDIHLCNDHDTDKDYDFKVRQTIRHGVLYTDIEKECKTVSGKTVKEESHMSMEIDEGTLLVYVPGLGYTIPEYNLITTKEALNQFKILEGEDYDIEGSTKEGTETD